MQLNEICAVCLYKYGKMDLAYVYSFIIHFTVPKVYLYLQCWISHTDHSFIKTERCMYKCLMKCRWLCHIIKLLLCWPGNSFRYSHWIAVWMYFIKANYTRQVLQNSLLNNIIDILFPQKILSVQLIFSLKNYFFVHCMHMYVLNSLNIIFQSI